MRDVLKDLLVGFLGALLVECAPKLALRLVSLAARAMPTPELRAEKLSDWTAEVLSAEGNAQKLVAAFWILVNVPNIRAGYGHWLINALWGIIFIQAVNTLVMLVIFVTTNEIFYLVLSVLMTVFIVGAFMSTLKLERLQKGQRR